ncbi:MAG: UDP-N-acetylmuramate--L-alanine ligase [Anaerolineales bacterium]|nr:UDP-N-acetylmuramate--L-alanine ligase [Anaerolineales bacterium]
MHVHFVGIGGAGLSAIARVLLEAGERVTGSDETASPFADALAQHGARIFAGHAAEHIDGAELVVISAAVPPDNAEVQAALARGVPVLKRADILGQMMQGRLGIAVAGTHGKTTTTGLIAFLLDQAGQDPTFIVGGWLADYGANARAGCGRAFVVEADEYDRMFLGLKPTVAVVTNVEHDHPDCYPTLTDMQAAFQAFVTLLPPDGLLVGYGRDAFVQHLVAERRAAGRPALRYGLQRDDDYRADSLQLNGAGGYDFLVVKSGATLGLARNRLPGEHNVLNSLAALAVADFMGVDFNVARNALAEYRGAGRRFEVKGEAHGVTVVDDYAHHPTEIRATLTAARRRFGGRPLWVMFQPHTFSRTRALLADFAASFGDADHVIVVDIFRSREAPDPALSASDIVRRMNHPDARYIPALVDAANYLCEQLKPGDVLLTLGAGDGDVVGNKVLAALGEGATG